MKAKKRIGIYGGTFSPVHIGHTAAAAAFAAYWQPDELYIMPAFLPPHKQLKGENEPERRLEMTRIAFSGMEGYGERIFVSDYELEQCSRSYTALTLGHFAGEGVRLCFLCGTDMFLTLDEWYRAADIMNMSEIALLRRESGDKNQIDEKKREYEAEYGAVIHIIEAPVVEISSTGLREMLARGEDASGYLAPGVYEYIRRHGLYGCRLQRD